MTNAPVSQVSIPSVVNQLRATFEARKTRSYEWRMAQLERLRAMIVENETAIFAALKADFSKPEYETYLTETAVTLAEINHTIKHLKRWMKPRRVATPMVNWPGHSKIVPEPLGVALIMAPWNYPFYLIISPLVGAIAAGNCAVLKPSELTPNTSAILTKYIAQYLDQDAFSVIEGGVDVATELLAQNCDHIFFTGSTQVGKIVMTAAAKNLTPVTLELGGKSPCIVNQDADLVVAARRIVWGKFVNAGQTCVAPDYVLVHADIADKLLAQIAIALREFYGDDPKTSLDFPKIVSANHFDRIVGLLDSGKVYVGGNSDAAERYIAPTVLTEVSPSSRIMSEEIFGPVLPVLPVADMNEAISFVNDRPKPLALYLFSNDKKMRRKVIDETSAGGMCINEVLMHLIVPDLPFGGVGPSGMGNYHGRASFDTFSHSKGVLLKSERFDLPLRYPPYTKKKFKWLRRVLKRAM